MRRLIIPALFTAMLIAANAVAQTVTGSGTTGAVPVFTGTSTVGNSPIAVSGSDVAIGTTSPMTTFDVNGTGYFGPPGFWMDGGTTLQVGASTDSNAELSVYQYGVAVAELGSKPNDTNLYLTNGYWNGDSGHPGWAFGSAYNSLVITRYGNFGIGTTSPGSKLEVDGNVTLTANSGASITFQDGTTQSTAYTGVTCGGDFAESVDVTGNRKRYEPGDVLVIDPNAPGKFLRASQPYSPYVAGIYSTRPGTVGRRQTTPKSPDEVPMAMTGIVPTKVSTENGPIKIGDLLVASSTPGMAMKGTNRKRLTGAVVGKALGSVDSGNGVIEVLVTLQ